MKVNFARLNHIFIPTTKAGRDRFRRGLLGRALTPFAAVYGRLTDEGRAVAVASFVVGGVGIDAISTSVHVLWSALFALVLGSLLVAWVYRLRKVTVDVEAPRRVTVGEPMRFTIVLRNDGERDARAVRVSRPFLPWDGKWIGAAPRAALVSSGTEQRVEAWASFADRGEHHLDSFHASALVPFGLAQGPSIGTRGCKFLVIPRIAPVTRIAEPARARFDPGGVALASRTGESMDLLGVRPYRPGDPVRSLHAKSWARSGAPVIREYQKEHLSRVGVVVLTNADEEREVEGLLSLTAGVVAYLARGEAIVDFLLIDDRAHELAVGRQRGSIDQALDVLACVDARAARPERKKVLAELTPRLATVTRVVVLATRWSEEDGALTDLVRVHGAGCTVLVVAPQKTKVPPGRDLITVSLEAVERQESLTL